MFRVQSKFFINKDVVKDYVVFIQEKYSTKEFITGDDFEFLSFITSF